MRARRLALAAAALPLALALAACSGGAAAPEATSTPAPTAVATPEATPTPDAASTLPPEQACANGIAVAEPEVNPGLVADCEMLLRARDALRGDASLDWGGGLAVADWEGVAVSGEPPRVTGLDLRGKGLTGSIPRELRRLRLGEVRLGGNALTGCVPSAFEDASGDAASLGLPWCLRYDRLDAAGEVAEAGEWAILGGNGEALTTWEQLRSEAATLRVHQTDAGGNSWASEFGAVAVNDLFEWRLADDCWVRYRVAGAPAAPSGSTGRWEFPVEWMTYAATGAGCKGAVDATATLSADEAAPLVVQAPDIFAPIRHGPFLLYPPDWEGALEEPTPYRTSSPSASGVRGAGASVSIVTRDIAEARRIPLWREPTLPAGWNFAKAQAGTLHSPVDGYRVVYINERGYYGATIDVSRMTKWPYRLWALDNGGSIRETRTIDGHWALVNYAPIGRPQGTTTVVQIFDEATGILYIVQGQDRNMQGANVGPVIEIARSLYRASAP